MAFTTWAAYKVQVLDAIVDSINSGSVVLEDIGTVGPDGVPRKFRSFEEWRTWINFVEGKVAQEAAATTGRGRILFMGAIQ